MPRPVQLLTISQARAFRQDRNAKVVAFVPTMGALHAGHASLVAQARALAGPDGIVLASIFVNPTQFAPHEDYARYPRTLDADLAILQANGCDALFLPAAEEMYPPTSTTRTAIHPGQIARDLEGAIRPGHFAGVCIVVAKLLNILTPTHLLLGQKDFQQQAILRKMVADLDMPVEVITCPTVREPDGLAMSSRNRYLDADQRGRAVVLSEALRWGVEQAKSNAEPGAIESGMAMMISDRGLQAQYVAVCRRSDLQPLHEIERGNTVLLVAAKNGETRLIDNMLA